MKTNKEVYVVLDNIRSLENVGSIFRTSDALAINKIYLCGISGITPQGTQIVLHPKIAKTALGAEKRVPWEYCAQAWRIIENLKRRGVQIVALEQAKSSIDISKFRPKFPLALIVGNEKKGVSQSLIKRCDKAVEIPMRGSKESLNVAAAFAIAGFEINRRRFG